jgi:hypothetical protein
MDDLLAKVPKKRTLADEIAEAFARLKADPPAEAGDAPGVRKPDELSREWVAWLVEQLCKRHEAGNPRRGVLTLPRIAQQARQRPEAPSGPSGRRISEKAVLHRVQHVQWLLEHGNEYGFDLPELLDGVPANGVVRLPTREKLQQNRGFW